MKSPDLETLVGAALAGALEKRGYTTLTPVQEAVLDPKHEGQDLRITSQTGSGKTVAVGLALRHFAQEPSPSKDGVAHPRALVVAPTRELAKQFEEELTWLYAPLRIRVASVTGGASYRDERRAFASGPSVIVGTPGRLLDHLNRGSVDPTQLGAIVLDEADRMLDLGFREDLEAILKHAPKGHRTHLVSATFPREVRALADRVQQDPAHVEGTPLGTANADIDHVIHLVAPRERVDAIINLLLATTPGAQTLIFARTRADVAEIARKLEEAEFKVATLSGEMEQRERNQALAAFKRGGLHALVATDVAARGIDVQDIGRVIHAEPPTDVDSYTHRSGRTGRAGRKGTSSVLVSPAGLAKTAHLLRRAGVRYRMEPIPTAESIRASADERLFASLTNDDDGSEDPDPRTWTMATRLAETGNPTRAIARLLIQSRMSGPTDARDVQAIDPRAERPMRMNDRGDRNDRYDLNDCGERGERGERDGGDRGERDGGGNRGGGGGWVSFRVSWGQEQGADARRLLAMVCRRGGIRGSDVGAIHIARTHSVVDVTGTVAQSFATATKEPDPRDPRVVIRQVEAGAAPHRRANFEPRGDQGGPPARREAPYAKARDNVHTTRENVQTAPKAAASVPKAPHSVPKAPHSVPKAPHSGAKIPKAPHSSTKVPKAPHSVPKAPHSGPKVPKAAHSVPKAPNSVPKAPRSKRDVGGGGSSPKPRTDVVHRAPRAGGNERPKRHRGA